MPFVSASAVTVDTSGLDKTLKGFRRDQLPFAKMLAIKDLAWDTIRVEQHEMTQVFDRPTPFVLRGLRVLKKAEKKDPTAVIGFTDITGRFGNRTENIVRTHIEGESRGNKAMENALRHAGFLGSGEYITHGPGAKLDVYGNITRKAYKAILDGLKRSAKGGSESKGKRYFVHRTGPAPGIYVVTGKKGRPKMLLHIVRDRPDYKKRFDFYGIADEHARKWGGYFARKAMDKALATAR